MDRLDAKVIDTPVGRMQAIATARGLCALEFVKPDRQKLLHARLDRWFANTTVTAHSNPHLAAAEHWLQLYFDGRFADLSEVVLDTRGTPFEARVWKALRKIPLGSTISYSELAARVGIPQAPRAAGGASRRNPLSLIVPCHRVIGLSGRLTGYGGGLEQKQFLLKHEGQAAIDRSVAI